MEEKHAITLHFSQSELLATCLFWGYRSEDKLLPKDELTRCRANLEKCFLLLTKEQQQTYKRDLELYRSNVDKSVIDALEQLKTFNESFKKFNES